jgi:hypothetical protein
MDQNKKTMRHFYCRDVLWETFEQMANDFDCSIDYLVNEAMRYYARSKNYQAPGTTGAPPMSAQVPSPGGVTYPPSNATQSPQRSERSLPRPTGPTMQHQAVGAARPVGPPTANYVRGSAPMQAEGHRMPSPSMAMGGAPAPAASGGTLFLIYNGQRYPVTKDQFIIGRGSKTSDLPIKDGNISRQHAAVIRRNGTFYIKDLGSTNGIDYKGMRIDNKRIDEGDVFHLCDYELRFTYADG